MPSVREARDSQRRALGAAERDRLRRRLPRRRRALRGRCRKSAGGDHRLHASHGYRARQIAGFYVLAVAVLFLVWFSGVLCRRLDAPFLLAVGSLTGGLLLAAGALWASTAVTVQHESGFVFDPNTHLLLEDAGFVLFVASMLGAVAFVAATSAAVLRTGELPRLVGFCGFAVVASLAASWYYLPVFALLACWRP